MLVFVLKALELAYMLNICIFVLHLSINIHNEVSVICLCGVLVPILNLNMGKLGCIQTTHFLIVQVLLNYHWVEKSC